MASLADQLRNLIPGVQQIFQNAGYNQQQGNRSVISGLIPRALGGTGLVAPVGASSGGSYTSTPKQTATPPGGNTPRPSAGNQGGGQPQVDLGNQGGGDGGYNADSARQSAEEQARRALEAAIGVFNTKAEGLRNRIPGVEAARDLRIRGLEEDLGSFNETAGREEGSRVADLDTTRKTTEDLYSTAERKTRASAKSLSRNLRQLFAGAGTLDSTQYRDYNVDQSKEIAQTLGDTRREGAGKVSTIDKEIEDTKGYYAEQRTQFAKKTALAKDQARAEADDKIQGIMDDINLTDSQKIEAVVAQQNKLDQRLGEIDQTEAKFKADAERDAKEIAIKLAELKSKGYSEGYKTTQANQKAFDSATKVIERLSQQLGSMTPATAAAVFTQYGIDPKESERLAFTLYGSSEKDANAGNPFSTP